MREYPHKCKPALSAQYSSGQSPNRSNKLFLPAKRRRADHWWPGIRGDISSQNRVFQYSGSRLQYRDPTCYELARSAPEHHPPISLVAASTTRIMRNVMQHLPAHIARQQICPTLSNAQSRAGVPSMPNHPLWSPPSTILLSIVPRVWFNPAASRCRARRQRGRPKSFQAQTAHRGLQLDVGRPTRLTGCLRRALLGRRLLPASHFPAKMGQPTQR
jgi:hypothetical protein